MLERNLKWSSYKGLLVDALVSTGEEGRATCEKLRGTGRGVDPKMSEWGNPTRVIACYPCLNT